MVRSLSTRRRNLPIPLNIMVVGSTGSGKTSFIDTCIKSLVVEEQYIDSKDKAPSPRYSKPLEITTRKVTTVSQGLKLALSFIDTPGFEVQQGLEAQEQLILEYIKSSLFLRLQEETRLKRNTKPKEEQVHVCLFFFQPELAKVSKLELTFAKKLSSYVNVIPVIGKADKCTVSELREMKTMIQRDFKYHSIPTFDFSEEEEDEETHCQNQKLQKLLPFALVSSEETQPKKPDGTQILGREYSWGIVECLNPNHSEMVFLKRALFETHFHILKEITYLRLYEDYRTEQLLYDLKHKSIGYSKKSEVSNPKEIPFQIESTTKPLDKEIIQSKLETPFDSRFSWDNTSNFHHNHHPSLIVPTEVISTCFLPEAHPLTNKPQLRNSSGKSVQQLRKLYSASTSKSKSKSKSSSSIRLKHELSTHLEQPIQIDPTRHQSFPVPLPKKTNHVEQERSSTIQSPKEPVLPALPENKNSSTSKPCKFRKTSKHHHANCTIN